jgi:hypothetical protein
MVYCRENCGENPMRVLRAAAVFALLVGPAYAQEPPHINLMPELASKTPEEREADEARDKAYKESLKKIPDAKGSADPWGNVRADPPKAAANTPKAAANTPKTAAKPRTKTATTPN